MNKPFLKIIDGKRYNTATATEVAQWCNNYPTSDFKFCWEILYRTSKGTWFLVGQGGAQSKYSRSYGNHGSCGGRDLIVLSETEAKAWLEAHEQNEALESYFADQLEDA
ncbi:MAG: hypothetical protein DMG76_23630 [Acidobacteria bacterium]|nr:MAG: hypothetical protein DMG76_23630 [Acidobacteriota bacterium]